MANEKRIGFYLFFYIVYLTLLFFLFSASKFDVEALLEENLEFKEPIHLAKKWREEALANPNLMFPKTMCLSTASKYGLAFN